MPSHITLYNTLGRRLEKLPDKKQIGLYTCGPTVYNYAHLGNLRTYIFEDLLQRVLEWNGRRVKRVMNITDVGHLTGDGDSGEDKIEKEAKAEKKTPRQIAAFYTRAFLRDLQALNIKKPSILAPATKYIPDQIRIIKALCRKGIAYETKAAVYFDVQKFKNYGKLSGQSLNEKLRAVRSEVVADSEKHHPADFALWFKLTGRYEHHILQWQSPWGAGFPGWHVECSAISSKFLGQPFDIHTGGVDHIGTHHENEIAQSEAAFGKPLARFWLHGEFLLVDYSKMAKSEENFFRLADLSGKNIHPLVFRYFALGTHYRAPLHFSWVALEHAKNGLQSLIERLLFLRFLADHGVGRKEKPDCKGMRTAFTAKINADLGIPQAFGFAQELLGKRDFGARNPKALLDLVLEFDKVFGLRLREFVRRASMDTLMRDIQLRRLLAKREDFRKRQQFIQSDRLRKEINQLGYLIEDTPYGQFARPAESIKLS